MASVTGLTAALAGKAPSSHTHEVDEVEGLEEDLDGKAASAHSHEIGNVTGLSTALGAKAPLDSPGFSGNPTAPTQAEGDASTKLATTAFVAQAVAGGVGSSTPPLALETAPASSTIQVSGVSLESNGTDGQNLFPNEAGLVNGRWSWGVPTGGRTYVHWDGAKWIFSDVSRVWHSTVDVQNPADAGVWNQVSGTAAALSLAEVGTPAVTLGGECVVASAYIHKCVRLHPVKWVELARADSVLAI